MTQTATPLIEQQGAAVKLIEMANTVLAIWRMAKKTAAAAIISTTAANTVQLKLK